VYKLIVVLCIVVLFSAPAVHSTGQTDSSAASGTGTQAIKTQSLVSDALSSMDNAFNAQESEFTPQDEYFLGRAVAAEILKAYPPYTGNPALTAYLEKICLALAVNSPRPLLFSGYHVEILDTSEICAFASPGGHIFVSRGLIAAAPSEDALAAVIAHELAHIQLRHVAAILANERTVQELTAAAERAVSIAARNLTEQEQLTLFQASLTASINTLFRDGYSREQEFQADRTALQILASAGYDPAALVEMLQIINQRQGTGNLSRTHPAPGVRIANLGNIPANARRGRETLSARQPRFNSALRDSR